MGVGKSMKIFTEAMQNTMKEGGFGSKIVTTAMGPFKWDDLQESWVNINNGFRMPNISMQDLLAFGYDSSEDGGESTAPVSICYSNLTTTLGNKTINVNYLGSWNSILNLQTPTNWTNSCPAYFFLYKAGSQTLSYTQLQFRYTVNGGLSWETYTPALGLGGHTHEIMNLNPSGQFGSGGDFDIQVQPTMTGGASFNYPTNPDGGANPEAYYTFYLISTDPSQQVIYTLSNITIETDNLLIEGP